MSQPIAKHTLSKQRTRKESKLGAKPHAILEIIIYTMVRKIKRIEGNVSDEVHDTLT